MRTSIIIVTALALGLGATAASAARRPVAKAVAAKVVPRFQAADTDSSRSLDNAEWAAAGAPADSFGLVDLNDNGSLGFFEIVRVTIAKAIKKRR